MANPNNPNHVAQGGDAAKDTTDDPHEDWKERESQNEEEAATSRTLQGEEPRDVQKAGGGTRGESQGGAHTGRYGAHPEATSNRESKPRGQDKE